jgi:hypothetical protein
VKYHFIRDHIEKKNIRLQGVNTSYNTADIFTKGLPYPRFNECREEMGMIRINN